VIAPAQELPRSVPDDTSNWWHLEQNNIDKLAQFTAQQHAAILFTIGDRVVGYANQGTVKQLSLPRRNPSCLYPHPTLSHDGQFLAFLSGEKSEHCEIALLNLATGRIEPLLDLTYNPGALSWSWDDSEIAFRDPRVLAPSIQALRVQDGSVRVLVPPSQLTIDGTQFGLLLGYFGAVQWTHTGNGLLVGFTRDVPTRQPDAYAVEFRIEEAKNGVLSNFRHGSYAAISPVADRVAWCGDGRIIVENLDGTRRQIRATSPRWMMGIFSTSFKGPLTWSPDGRQLFFGVHESEDCSDDVYLLQIETRRSKRFLHNSCITIEDWR